MVCMQVQGHLHGDLNIDLMTLKLFKVKLVPFDLKPGKLGMLSFV